ncbi:(dimethylallyl)adenosine tRNA methylthiotransferase MiaB [Weissella oryzae SG25]|uniref:(Dimethylallyl)adenosine tRNA methylthiotransferase MiaB n=1 Tax=Weissella oryzae (strain DSM 25784 / JCM 18191 / LMG 30913 / SG25) TaxID=1329250 RepID=A0A069CS63_WEIOS|nr:(dimethylallyl)adenosine tRNA methylthiotransferase MiaB [Weissella oryzae SG25]
MTFSQQNQRVLCNQINYYLCREDLYYHLRKNEALKHGLLIKNGKREVYYLGQNIYRFKGPSFDFNYEIPF